MVSTERRNKKYKWERADRPASAARMAPPRGQGARVERRRQRRTLQQASRRAAAEKKEGSSLHSRGGGGGDGAPMKPVG